MSFIHLTWPHLHVPGLSWPQHITTHLTTHFSFQLVSHCQIAMYRLFKSFTVSITYRLQRDLWSRNLQNRHRFDGPTYIPLQKLQTICLFLIKYYSHYTFMLFIAFTVMLDLDPSHEHPKTRGVILSILNIDTWPRLDGCSKYSWRNNSRGGKAYVITSHLWSRLWVMHNK